MAKQITDTGTATLALALLSAAGNPVADPITLSSSDPAVVTTTAGVLTAIYEITVVAGPAAKLTLDEVIVA